MQKLEEVAVLARGLDRGDAAIAGELARSGAVVRSRAASPSVHDAQVAARLGTAAPEMERRPAEFARRRVAQRALMPLPNFPTTTIGSFPQTKAVREVRAALARHDMTQADYDTAIEGWIAEAIRFQEELGLDVLVHGESERNDMVKYFGEQLRGFAFTQHGWVQILWQPLRRAADHLGRRLAAGADDRALGGLCPDRSPTSR